MVSNHVRICRVLTFDTTRGEIQIVTEAFRGGSGQMKPEHVRHNFSASLEIL